MGKEEGVTPPRAWSRPSSPPLSPKGKHKRDAIGRGACSCTPLPTRDGLLRSHHVDWFYWLRCLTEWGWDATGGIPVPGWLAPAPAAPAAPRPPTRRHRGVSQGPNTSTSVPSTGAEWVARSPRPGNGIFTTHLRRAHAAHGPRDAAGVWRLLSCAITYVPKPLHPRARDIPPSPSPASSSPADAAAQGQTSHRREGAPSGGDGSALSHGRAHGCSTGRCGERSPIPAAPAPTRRRSCKAEGICGACSPLRRSLRGPAPTLLSPVPFVGALRRSQVQMLCCLPSQLEGETRDAQRRRAGGHTARRRSSRLPIDPQEGVSHQQPQHPGLHRVPPAREDGGCCHQRQGSGTRRSPTCLCQRCQTKPLRSPSHTDGPSSLLREAAFTRAGCTAAGSEL